MAYLTDLSLGVDAKDTVCVLMEDTKALTALLKLNAAVQALAELPAWQVAMAEARVPLRGDLELSHTEQLIMEGLACEMVKCGGNTARMGELLSDADPAVVAKFLPRILLWQKALLELDMGGLVPWPKHATDIVAYVVIKCPPQLPPGFAQTC